MAANSIRQQLNRAVYAASAWIKTHGHYYVDH